MELVSLALGLELTRPQLDLIASSIPDPARHPSGKEELCTALRPYVNARPRDVELHRAFRLLDDDDTGYLTASNLSRAAQDLGL